MATDARESLVSGFDAFASRFGHPESVIAFGHAVSHIRQELNDNPRGCSSRPCKPSWLGPAC